MVLISRTKKRIMNIIGTVKQNNIGESYFVGWEEYERIVYISPNISGPWIEVEQDVMYENVAIATAQNYVDSKNQQLQYQIQE